MAYTRDLRSAAERHLRAANLLHPCDRIEECQSRDVPDVAGYLYGIAAELAVKAMMWSLGMRELEQREEDPYYCHFPDLKTRLRDHLSGRHESTLTEFIADRFMSEWDISMRYAGSATVRKRPIDRWKKDACRALEKMREVM